MNKPRPLESLLSRAITLALATTALPAQEASGPGVFVADSPSTDWLIERAPYVARVRTGEREIVLENGLVRRIFRLDPNAATVALDDLRTGASLLRSVRPEARVVISGKAFDIGGLRGHSNHAFLLPEWLDALEIDPESFRYAGYETGVPVERFPWKQTRHCAPDVAWPPPGVALRLDFDPPLGVLAGLRVAVHYELYDGVPILSKWVSVSNGTPDSIELDRLTVEVLAVVESSNWVESRTGVSVPEPTSLHVETDYAFGGFTPQNAMRHSVHWRPDPDYDTQVNYAKKTPCLLEVEPLRGPDVVIEAGSTFSSFRVFELLHDSTDRERRGLALRRFYRTLAPWVTENPLILHVVSVDPDVVRTAIDQAAECGFEMVSLSFGSGLNMEDEDPINLRRFRELTDYAAGRGIHLGGYSLLSSRRIQPDSDNCIHPETGEPGGQTHGFCPALASDWGRDYFRKLSTFFETTGFLQFTHDGSYPGDWDASARPPYQRGLEDSQWVQWEIITRFYRFLRSRGVYVRVPDFYYLNGSNECGMGYREVNWSLPRDEQVIHTRQNIYDGTWEKTPSMGWMFVPLTQYHGGGAAATIEPLDEHLAHYDRMLASNLGLGVQAVYRGHRLYDTERVRDAVIRRVEWYRANRDILESDLVHGRRADGRDVDWMLHVNPELETRGMLVVYNPLAVDVERELTIPLYYTGLVDRVQLLWSDGREETKSLARDHSVDVIVRVAAGDMAWCALR